VTEPKKEMSHEYRTLLAVILCLAVLIGASYFNKPKPQPQPEQSPAAQSAATQNPQTPAAPAPTTPSPTAKNSAPAGSPAQAATISPAPVSSVPAHAATAERTIVVESGVYHVELSNKGAVAHKWILEKYTDESSPPRALDLVHADAAAQFGGWPLAVVMDDPQLESRANSALYEVTVTPDTPGAIQAPAEVDFTWSDGHLSVTKKLKFDTSYIANVQITAELDGRPVAAALAWRGGFGDPGAFRGRGSQSTQAFYSQGGKLELLAANKLGVADNSAQKNVLSGPMDFA